MESIDFSGKKVAVLGFGIEGESTIRFLLKRDAELRVFDEKQEAQFDKDKLEEYRKSGVVFNFSKLPSDFSEFDVVVRSPGISPEREEIKKAIKNRTIVTSPTKIFFDLCPSKIIGITGTKGKGTTSSLIYEMLKEQGFKAYLGGNIGTPPLDFLNELDEKSWVVLELSSFQLQDLHKSPYIAVLLMVTSEHLDYHKDVYEYVQAKRNILGFQTASDFAIINKDYPASRESDIYTNGQIFQVSTGSDTKEGCFINNSEIVVSRKFAQSQNSKFKSQNIDTKIISIREILLPGRHNLENVCAAVMAAVLAGVSKKDIINVLKSFKGLEHRLELAGTINGVRYYDDSFSTTPETAMAAIEAFKEPEILILGGSSKGSDFTHLGEVINKAENIKAIIGIGVEWKKIKLKIKNEKLKIIEGCKNMKEIVRTAFDAAEYGDVVVLSPACASFDMFKNYKDRGEQFKKEVNNLKAKN